jgi:hypothetical protein
MSVPTDPTCITALCDQLDQLREAATPGPWQLDKGGDYHQPWWHAPDVLREPYGRNALDVGGDEATGALIVAAVNALPRLTAALRAVEALAEQAEQKYDGVGNVSTDDLRAALATVAGQ